jgi:hypothetical protein
MRRSCSTRDDHVTQVLWDGFQPEDAHIDDIVMHKGARRVLRIQVVEGKRMGGSYPLHVHSIASFRTALMTPT